MALKFKCKAKEEIPAEVQNLYVEREGVWLLDVEGAVEKSKLDEFRNNNLVLLKERDELKSRFEGIDPDEVRKLAEEKRKLEEAQQLKAGEVEKVVEARVKSSRGELDKQISTLASERDALNTRLVAIQIDQGIITVATKRGLRPTAIPDITGRARNIFKLVNGVPTAFESDGQTVRHGKDGVSPMALEEWVDTQVSEAPHLFEANAGAGGASALPPGAGGRSYSSVRNPWKQETWNVTEQMKLQKSDPRLAAQLKAVG